MPAPQKRRPRLRPHGHTRAMLTSATCALGRPGLDPQSLPPRPTLLLLPPPRPTHTPTGALPSAKPSPLAFNVLLITVLYGRTSRAPYSCDREQKVLAWGGRGLPRGPQGVAGGTTTTCGPRGEVKDPDRQTAGRAGRLGGGGFSARTRHLAHGQAPVGEVTATARAQLRPERGGRK